MNLINTSGLALIGPGSEWFWSMVQFFAVLITLLGIYRQLKAQAVANALGKLQFLEDRWNADRMSYARLTTAQSLKTAKPAAGMEPAMIEIADFWEDIAGLLEDGHVRLTDLQGWSGSCQLWWASLKPAVEAERVVLQTAVYDSWQRLEGLLRAHDLNLGEPIRLDVTTVPKFLDSSIRINTGRLQISQDLAAGRMPALPK
jgi:hypothetical protein